MNVVVCIKQVPGTANVQIDPVKNTLIRQGVKGIINPFDTYALEEGLRLRDKFGGKVTAITMGPPQAEEALKEALSLGAEEAILISDPLFAGSDTLATSCVLAKAIHKIRQYDLVICGRQTLDGDTGQVAPELAERLSLPFIAYVSQIQEIGQGRLKVRRMVEDGYEVIESSLPAVITVVKEINVPRLPSLRGLARSKSAKIPIWTAQELGIEGSQAGIKGSPTRVVHIFYPQRVRRGEVLQGNLEEQIGNLVDKLRESRAI